MRGRQDGKLDANTVFVVRGLERVNIFVKRVGRDGKTSGTIHADLLGKVKIYILIKDANRHGTLVVMHGSHVAEDADGAVVVGFGVHPEGILGLRPCLLSGAKGGERNAE